MRDPDLWPVIAGADRDELAALATIIDERSWGYDAPPDPGAPASRESLHDAVLRAGGHALVNLVRHRGPAWATIVRDVAKKLGLPRDDADDGSEALAQLERQIAATVITRMVRRLPAERRAQLDREVLADLSEQERRELDAIVSLERLEAEDFGPLAAVLLDIGPPRERGRHAGAQRALMVSLARQTLRRKAIVVGLKLLGVGGGPFGNAVTAAGPAYRATIPAVLWVAIARTRLTPA